MLLTNIGVGLVSDLRMEAEIPSGGLSLRIGVDEGVGCGGGRVELELTFIDEAPVNLESRTEVRGLRVEEKDDG